MEPKPPTSPKQLPTSPKPPASPSTSPSKRLRPGILTIDRKGAVATPPPPTEKFEGKELVTLSDGRLRVDSPRLCRAIANTGVALDELALVPKPYFVLQARREGKDEVAAERIGRRRFNLAETMRQAQLAELLEERGRIAALTSAGAGAGTGALSP